MGNLLFLIGRGCPLCCATLIVPCGDVSVEEMTDDVIYSMFGFLSQGFAYFLKMLPDCTHGEGLFPQEQDILSIFCRFLMMMDLDQY